MNNDLGQRVAEREKKIGALLTVCLIALADADMAKRLAVKRYMTSYLRAMTDFDLDFEFKHFRATGQPSAEILFKLSQASAGYDRFMERRRAKLE